MLKGHVQKHWKMNQLYESAALREEMAAPLGKNGIGPSWLLQSLVTLPRRTSPSRGKSHPKKMLPYCSP